MTRRMLPFERLQVVPATLLMCSAMSTVFVPLSGCDRPEIEERTVAKGVEEVPAAPDAAPSPQTSTTDKQETPDHAWAIPDGWREDPTPRPMRLTTYLAPDPAGDVEVAVTRFPGRVGGELANINRWRGQMGLDPITAEQLAEYVERFQSEGFEAYTTRIESPMGVMLAAGVYEAASDQTWFLRATVPDATVADRLLPDFVGMALSIAGIKPGEEG